MNNDCEEDRIVEWIHSKSADYDQNLSFEKNTYIFSFADILEGQLSTLVRVRRVTGEL